MQRIFGTDQNAPEMHAGWICNTLQLRKTGSRMETILQEGARMGLIGVNG
jgi:hypothetical protein